MAKKRKAPSSTRTKPDPEPEPEPESQPDPQPNQIEELNHPEHDEVQEENPDTNNDQPNENEYESEPEEEEEENGIDEDEPIENLLEPLGKGQLTLLIKDAISKHSDLISTVHSLADADPSHRKIFVRGLGWETTTETLTSTFSLFGSIEDCKHVTDKATGKSKGYAFILFKHRSGAKKALAEPQKKIGSRLVSCQLASAGPVQTPPPAAVVPPVSEYTQRKIFVSNVAAELDPGKVTEFFKQFGEIEEGPLGIDKVTGRPKGFCLFVYKSVESAKKALEEPHKVFEGVTLHCYKAIDGPKPGHMGGFQSSYPQSSKRFKGGKYPSRGGPLPGQQHMAMMDPATAALAPALGQALTTLLAGQGGGFGNYIGGYGAADSQGMPPQQGYGGGGYDMQAAYSNPQMGQGGGRPQMGGGAPYMGQGY